MGLNLEETACVARGTFNIYIFQPEWIAQFLNATDPISGSLQADFREPGFRISFDDGDVLWTIRPDGLLLGSPDLAKNCGEIVATVLEKLPETPLKAIGNNFTFQAKAEGSLAEVKPSLRTWLSSASENTAACAYSAGCSIEMDTATYNTSIAISEDILRVEVNAHREAGKGEAGRAAARRFLQDYEESVRLIENVYGLRVEQP